MRIIDKNKTVFYFIFFTLFMPLLLINVKSSHDWGGDFAQYINQAKCIVEGKSQNETGYIFNEQNPFIGPPSYPVGFPMLLTPVYCLFGNNLEVKGTVCSSGSEATLSSTVTLIFALV